LGLLSTAAIFDVIAADPPGNRARRIGALHGLGGALVLVLFGLSWLLRFRGRGLETGRRCVGPQLRRRRPGHGDRLARRRACRRLGVGVDDGAHLDAPSSLSHRHLGHR